MRILLLFISLVTILEGKLIPTPFFMSMQRVGRDSSLKYFDKNLFHDVYGIAMVKPRGTDSTLLITSDPDWNRLVYTHLDESGQGGKYLKAYGGYGTAFGKFIVPKGLCIDTTIYTDSINQHAIYVADSWNDRVSKLIYSITKDTIRSDGIVAVGLSNPTDVACASKTGGGAYIVIVENGVHRIRLYERNADGTISWVQNYGTQGPRLGQFFRPNGVSICLATDGGGGYFIYITDTGNRRVVCLRYKPSEGITWKGDYKTLENARFLSVTASQYYCVYVTDFLQNKIWVFTPGLGELLYTYGNSSLLNGPKDIYIDWDRIGLTERWTASTGIQYFKIIPEIREFHPDPNNFDATDTSTTINFKVYETKHYLTLTVAGRELFTDQEFWPGSHSVYWDGRDAEGKVVLPGEYAIELHCGTHLVGNAVVAIKGMKVEDIAEGHWISAGNPYVLVGDCEVPSGDSLVIDAGVWIMGYDTTSVLLDSGVVIANGLETDLIVFTSHRKIDVDPVYPGMWKGLVINNSESQLKYCNVEYAGAHDSAAVFCTNADIIPAIENCYFKENNAAPMRISAKGIPFISNNGFENNVDPVIEIIACGVTGDAVWHAENLPYRVIGNNLSLFGDPQDTVKLSILPGVELRFRENAVFTVGGVYPVEFDATGTPESLIVFTTDIDSLHWQGLKFFGETFLDSFILKNCLIEKAGLDIAAIDIQNDTGVVIIDSCKIFNSAKYGVWLDNKRRCNLSITNSIFEEDSIPARCLFTGTFGFGAGNEYLNNTINKIEVYPCSLRYDMTIQKQEIPYWFRKTAVRKNYEVYGDTNYVATLTIEPGTHIEFEDSTVLKIGHDYRMGMYWYNQRGRLICEGLEDDSIRLTMPGYSMLDAGYSIRDTGFSRAGVEKNSGQKDRDNPLFWRGLRFDKRNNPIDTSTITYTSIEYAGLDTAAIIFGDSASISIIDSRIFKSKNYGIWMPNARSYDNLVISNCLFEEDSIPVRTAFNNLTDLYTCSFSNNIVNAIEVVPYYYGFEWRDIIIHHQDVPYWFLSIPSMDWKEFSFYGGVDHCASVTIEPGTRMLFADSTLLRGGYPGYSWRAKIIAMGTEQDSIIFSALDTINGWRGIQMNSYDPADTSIFEYCRISYGGQEVPTGLPSYKTYGNLVFFGPHIPYILKNSALNHSKTIGLNHHPSGGDLSVIPMIQDNSFVHNDSFPLVIWANVLRELKNNTFIEDKNDEIYVYSERINKSLVWQNQGVPYIVDGQMNVDGHGDTTVTLEIESGNVIKFKQDKQLWILEDSRLLAHSTKFTGADSLPWNQIYFRNADTSLIDSCVIEHTHKTQFSYPGAVCIKDNSIVAIKNSTITNNEDGIYIYGNLPSVEVINNKIHLNERGIYNSSVSSQVYVKYNEFFGNKCAFRNDVSSNIIQADSNWWGHATGPWDPSEGLPDYNPGGEGDSIGDYVQYRPWLTEPVHPPVVTLIQPNGAETLYCETDYEIKWTRNLKGNSGQFRVDYPSPLPSPTRGEGIQILRQELYYTTDFPEGGGLKGDFFWIFIDTVAVSETSYVWQVPVVSSDRCRVAIVLYYENTLIDPRPSQMSGVNADNPLGAEPRDEANTDLHGMLNEYELQGISTNNEIATATVSPRNDNPSPYPSPTRGEGNKGQEIASPSARKDNVEKENKETWRQGETETERNGDTKTGRRVNLDKEIVEFQNEKKVVENKLFDDYDGPGTIMIAVDISDANFSIIPIYTLTIYTIGQGTVIKNPDLPTFLEGTVCTLSAIPDSHWEFDHWKDSLSGSNNPETITMNSDKIVTATFTPSGYVLNLDSFPMYQAESLPGYNEMCGPAVAQMALNYMFWNRNTDPDSVPMLPEFAQDVLYDYGTEHNADPGLEYFDLQGMWHTIQDKKPMPYSEYGYNFTKRHNTDQYTMLKLICQWIDYTVGTYGGHKDGHPYHVPSIVPAYGNYTNWMAVRGIHTDTAAYPMPDTLTIYGFWVNDPYPASMGGVGENSYKIISDWNSIYYLSMTVGDYIDEYLAVLEPPESVEGCYLILAEPIIRFNDQQMNQLDEMTDRLFTQGDINQWIIQAAINGVTEELIPYDEKFEEIFRTTVPGVPLLVKHINNNDDYYMVPFIISSPRIKISSQEKSVVADKLRIISKIEDAGSVHDDKMSLVTAEDINAKTLVVILIDADDGHFKETSWADTPVKYLPISKTEAKQIAFDTAEELGLEVTDINDLHPELIYRKSTPYYPEWCVIIEEYAIYISQDGSVSIEEPGKGGKGTGGVMSDQGSFAYSLNTAAPTPFVNSTTISYSIARPGRVSLNIYDISGRLIKTLVDENMDAGAYRLEWYGYDNNNHKVTPGVYFIKLTSDNFRSIKKVIFVR